MQLSGIHHLTAISAKPRENLAFYTGLLGMRLVKKTVNQDDVRAYHLFYADGKANPAPTSLSSIFRQLRSGAAATAFPLPHCALPASKASGFGGIGSSRRGATPVTPPK